MKFKLNQIVADYGEGRDRNYYKIIEVGDNYYGVKFLRTYDGFTTSYSKKQSESVFLKIENERIIRVLFD